MKIQVQIKQVYGKDTIYPICDNAKKFAALLGTKTITFKALQGIKSLGYSIEVINNTTSL